MLKRIKTKRVMYNKKEVAGHCNVVFFVVFFAGLLSAALPTIIIDPCFHYHGPLRGIAYPLNDERYQNNGIVRHFEYDALITGTSMTENFKATEMDELFGVKSIKVPYSGGSYKEISDNILVALNANPNLKMVLVGADLYALVEDKDAPFHGIKDYNYVYPWYMIDNNYLTDVSYIFNKGILLNKTKIVIDYTREGGRTTSFDEYSFWESEHTFGKDAVLGSYTRPSEKASEMVELSNEERLMVRENVKQNITNMALAYPDTVFYVFIPPYSICDWDSRNQYGTTEWSIAALETAAEEMLKADNIKLFAFGEREDIVCDLDNYKDTGHYSAAVNSEILRCMKNDENRLTRENYREYFRRLCEFYTNYDYDSIYE